MTQRHTIQFLSMEPPLRQVLVHDRDEAVVVMTFYEMDEFVHDDILKALHGLLGEFKVHPDAARFHVATAPLGFHLLDSPGSYLNTQNRLPFLQESRDQFPQLLTIPSFQHHLAMPGIGSWWHM
jgi:hypothetical protein